MAGQKEEENVRAGGLESVMKPELAEALYTQTAELYRGYVGKPPDLSSLSEKDRVEVGRLLFILSMHLTKGHAFGNRRPRGRK